MPSTVKPETSFSKKALGVELSVANSQNCSHMLVGIAAALAGHKLAEHFW
jgi:hypothetical protein